MVSAEERAVVLASVQAASEQWKAAFNAGDAAGCAAQYDPDAVMTAEPFGTFTGTVEIQQFWQQLVDDGFGDVDYLDPKIEVVDATSAVLKSGWKMNKAKGVIHKELWILQADGSAKLREDHFEAKS